MFPPPSQVNNELMAAGKETNRHDTSFFPFHFRLCRVCRDKLQAAYEQALALNPTYSEAIEYRAEAYLALNRLDDAKASYLTLLANARPHAAVLLQSMQQWLAERRKQPAGVAAADLDAFARWVDERAAVASQTASLAPGFVAVRRWD